MKIKSLMPLLMLAACVCAAPAAPVLPVAVFNFEATDDAVRDLGPKVAVLLSAFLSAEPDMITVERAELDKMLGEQELGLSGTIAPESAAKVGHLTGAKVLVTGRAFMAGRELMLVAKIIGAETGRVYGEVVKGTSTAAIGELSADLGKRIARVVREKSDTLAAKVPTRGERAARIKQALGDRKLPVLLVKIPETHFGAQAVDPAAETEMSLLAQQAGFRLVDGSGALPPDVELRGEAFSERGLRKGNLISCKARVEVKAVEIRTGKILWADRETRVAVDLSEQIAGKTALQDAAAELAERILLKLPK